MAARQTGARGIVIGGGVAANSRLRERILDACIEDDVKAFLPGREMCTDNAAMIAAAGLRKFRAGITSSLELNADAALPL